MEIGRLLLFRLLLFLRDGSANNLKLTINAKVSKLEGILRHHVENCILKAEKDIEDTDFDVSTLLSIIRNCKVLNKRDEPTEVWGRLEIKPQNKRKGDDIERIRLMRNSLCHNHIAAMNESNFNTFVTDMKDIAQRLYTESMDLIPDIEKIEERSLSGKEINDILHKFVEETKRDLSPDFSQEQAAELHVVVKSMFYYTNS